MDNLRYIGLDVHRDTISAAVLDREGKLIMQSVVPTRAPAILDFLHGIRGTLHLTFEEGIHSAWLYDLLQRRVARVVVCDPRKNKLLKSGNKGDLIDARKLAELLRNNSLSPVYHGELNALEVQRRARSYTMLTEDTTRIMSRLKAVFRSQAISCHGKSVFRPDHREAYLAQLPTPGLRQRAELLYQELQAVHLLRLQAKREMLAECRKHPAMKSLRSVPFLGKVRTAVLIGRVQTPHRFRTKRQFWSYCGLALETHDSAQYHVVHDQIQRKPRFVQVRGLNWNHNHDLKSVFKSAATMAAHRDGVFREVYCGLLAKGMRPEMARLTLARKIAAITLKIWKEGGTFNAEQVKPQAA
ncbi:MAG: IS110 family transposase [Candidatus Acidiferrales bacterium]